MSFTIKCNACGNEEEITSANVRDFVNEYAWNHSEFKVSEDMSIGAFVTYDTTNETVICKCGHRL